MSESQRPRGAIIEIVERRRIPVADTEFSDIIIPDDIRINGQSLLAPVDHPIKVHELEIGSDSMVLVTLTLVAKRVVIGHEPTDGLDVERREQPRMTLAAGELADDPAGQPAEHAAEYRLKLAGRGLIPTEAVA